MWCSMETVGGVTAQRIHSYVIHGGLFLNEKEKKNPRLH